MTHIQGDGVDHAVAAPVDNVEEIPAATLKILNSLL